MCVVKSLTQNSLGGIHDENRSARMFSSLFPLCQVQHFSYYLFA